MTSHDLKEEPAMTSPRKRQSLYVLTLFLGAVFLLLFGHRYVLLLQRPSLPTATKSASSTLQIITNSNSTTALPPLNQLINSNGKIAGDISSLLDFAIIGFPKSGTSFLKQYLNQTNETFVYHVEFCIKKPSDLTRFVKEYHALRVRFQEEYPNKVVKLGVKCPGVLYRSYDLKVYQEYFPNTKLIIGIRHPVQWFESFYNYQAGRNVSLPSSTLKLVGKCQKHEKVCTDRARFHAALARLRKTPLMEREEVNLLFGRRYEGVDYTNGGGNISSSSSHFQERALKSQQQHNHHAAFPNQLLLYEVRQLHQNETSKQLSKTLRKYLGVNSHFPPIQSYRNIKPRAINICDNKHSSVRRLLVEHGTDAALWIREYLVQSPAVEIASPESFYGLLEGWSVDPCANAGNLL